MGTVSLTSKTHHTTNERVRGVHATRSQFTPTQRPRQTALVKRLNDDVFAQFTLKKTLQPLLDTKLQLANTLL